MPYNLVSSVYNDILNNLCSYFDNWFTLICHTIYNVSTGYRVKRCYLRNTIVVELQHGYTH